MAEYIERKSLLEKAQNERIRLGYDIVSVRDIESMPAADVECGGRLRGVTYEDGKVTAVHIRDTDDAVKVFAPVRHEKWEVIVGSDGKEHMVCTRCRKQQDLTGVFTYCPNCGAKMDLED